MSPPQHSSCTRYTWCSSSSTACNRLAWELACSLQQCCTSISIWAVRSLRPSCFRSTLTAYCSPVALSVTACTFACVPWPSNSPMV
jgi:hypothetical protein